MPTKSTKKGARKASVDIVGLGPGRLDQLTLEAEETLMRSKRVYCRFVTPLLAYFIDKKKKDVYTFEDLYQDTSLAQGLSRSDLYRSIASTVVEEAQKSRGVVYALPGSPVALEMTPYYIYEFARRKKMAVRTVLGVSFIDVLLDALPLPYKKYLFPQFTITAGNLDMLFQPFYSYIIGLTPDLLRRYGVEGIQKRLSKSFPKDFKFLLLYPIEDYQKFTYEMKVKEFRCADLSKKRLQGLFNGAGSLFIPAQGVDYQQAQAPAGLKKPRTTTSKKKR